MQHDERGRKLWEFLIKASGFAIKPFVWGWPSSPFDFFLYHHHPPVLLTRGSNFCGPLYLFHAGIGGIDGQDTAYEEEGEEWAKEEGGGKVEHHKPTSPQKATPFGFEIPLDPGACETALKLSKPAAPSQHSDTPFEIASRILDLLNRGVLAEAKSCLRDLRASVQHYFSLTLTATGRPLNDVIMADHVLSSSALVRAATARTLFETAAYEGGCLYKMPLRYPNDPKAWPKTAFMLLSIATNFDHLIHKGNKVGDVLGYKQGIETVLEAIRNELEDDWGLAGCLYRDQSSLHLALPFLADPIDRFATLNTTGSSKSLEPFLPSGGEPITRRDLNEWVVKRVVGVADEFGRNVGLAHELVLGMRIAPMKFELNRVSEGIKWAREQRMLAGAEGVQVESHDTFTCFHLVGDLKVLHEGWLSKRLEVCPVCRLRPADHEIQKVCKTCADRRKGRLGNWLKAPPDGAPGETIWLCEVADDANGMVALIQGRFFLDPWLKEKFQPGCFTYSKDKVPDPKDWFKGCGGPKISSPGRLRRVWGSTLLFWQEIRQMLAGRKELRADTRLYLKVDLTPQPQKGALFDLRWRPSDTKADQGRSEAVWDGERLILHCSHKAAAVDFAGRDIEIRPQDGERKDRRFTPAKVDGWEPSESPSFRFITVTLSPTDFMILVPGNFASRLLESIIAKYRSEMGRVRHRLSLNLGCLHFKQNFPLYLALDAARLQMRRLERARGDKPLRVKAGKTGMTLALSDYPTDVGPQTFPRVIHEFTASLDAAPFLESKKSEAEDIFYPYIQVGDSIDWKSNYSHINTFSDAEVYQYPSLLSYMELDSFSRRLEFTRTWEEIPLLYRCHYPLEVWDSIIDIQKGIMNTGLSKSQRKAFLAEAERVVESWKPDHHLGGAQLDELKSDYIGALFGRQAPEATERQLISGSAGSGLLFLAARLAKIGTEQEKEEIKR